jgi:lipopolysaccharide/colanic/teichoic acid biosynthesis glycosyltransferase
VAYASGGKRAADIATAAAGMVLASPVLAVSAIAIRLDSPGPVVLRQRRVGRNGAEFEMLKLRTMVADAEQRLESLRHLNVHGTEHGDPRMFKLAGDPRITRVGRMLRRFSIDELPQLVNVLRGEMSVVGPRPLLPEEDRHVVGAARLRLDVRPGITGPWQVAGRNRLSFEQMLVLDCAYAAGVSARGDLRLLARTLPALLRGEAGR